MKKKLNNKIIKLNLFYFIEPLEKLQPLVKQLHEEVEIEQRKLIDAIGKWKTPKRASNVLFYGSM